PFSSLSPRATGQSSAPSSRAWASHGGQASTGESARIGPRRWRSSALACGWWFWRRPAPARPSGKYSQRQAGWKLKRSSKESHNLKGGQRTMRWHRAPLLLALLVPCAPQVTRAEEQVAKSSNSISAEKIREHISFLASDEL